MKRFIAIGLSLFLAATAAHADATDKVRQAVAKLVPGGSIEAIQPSPIPGLYEAIVDMRVFYVSEDGQYLMSGKLYEVETSRDMTTPRLSGVRAKILSEIEDKDTIIFAPKEYRHTLTVFTDIDCPYCVKMHREMDQYLEAGIRVRYLMFPRAGIGSGSYDKAVSVWCAEDQQEAMTLSKNGQKIPELNCDNPVKNHMQLVQALNVRGTPAVFDEAGEQLGGYVPIARLAARLNAKGN